VQEETPALVGFQGEHGAWGEIAIRQIDSTMVPIPCLEFGNVFSGVASGEFDYGVAPIENSIEGSISEVNDLLIETDLRIVGEVVVPIHQNLLVLPGCDYREIKVVYSHPQALAQCRAFLSRNKLQARPFYDTAGAARWLSYERPASAAVLASKLAAELYGLDIVKESVEDNAENHTRFVLLSQRPNGKGGTKCTLAFSTQHRAGALFEVLRVFTENGLNLTRIESRPVRRNPGAYAFLLDFLGSEHEGRVQTALRSIKDKTTTMKVLGFYPEART
jgi:prephenate dehydratase/chorismate mutase/prephenate dehydratase